MNLLWDVMSDVVVTGIGLFYFSEKLSKLKKAGVILSFISIILLTWKDGSE
jgi:drug/metabolite transporter (DMT)-like permease